MADNGIPNLKKRNFMMPGSRQVLSNEERLKLRSGEGFGPPDTQTHSNIGQTIISEKKGFTDSSVEVPVTDGKFDTKLTDKSPQFPPQHHTQTKNLDKGVSFGASHRTHLNTHQS